MNLLTLFLLNQQPFKRIKYAEILSFFISIRYTILNRIKNFKQMKTIFFITGTSSGIGKSLVKEILQGNQNRVFGFSRSSVSFNHKNYTHQNIDLSIQDNLIQFEFPKVENFDKLVLINNAGLLAPINHIGKQNNQQIVDLFTVNLIAPSILSNIFLNTFSFDDSIKIILNIGSGAAYAPYDGWSAYCSSKSGLHMHTNVLKEEIERENRQNTYAFCILPGIIDTKMQKLIREQDKDKFVEFYEKNELTQPSKTAKELLKVIENPTKYETISDLRNLQ